MKSNRKDAATEARNSPLHSLSTASSHPVLHLLLVTSLWRKLLKLYYRKKQKYFLSNNWWFDLDRAQKTWQFIVLKSKTPSQLNLKDPIPSSKSLLDFWQSTFEWMKLNSFLPQFSALENVFIAIGLYCVYQSFTESYTEGLLKPDGSVI